MSETEGGAAIGTIGVLGAGAWGTALALAVARAGRPVRLWARDGEQRRAMRETRENRRHLPGVALDPGIAIEERAEALAGLEAVLLAVPAQEVRRASAALAQSRGTIVCCAKGLERATGLRLSEVLGETCPDARPAVLSGPSFAAEVAAGLPTAVTIAAADRTLAADLARTLASPTFRPYPSDDLQGVEIGGALKNVIAIAAGVVIGRGLGENARAAVITRGLAELSRLAMALGARRETLTGLSGLGDLLLTATSLTSRNTSFGYALSRGETPAALMAAGRKLSEGAWTAAAACRLAGRVGVELPITEAVRAVVEGECDVAAAIESLLSRPLALSE
ncbi:MAG TPA: NAD(P)H-dependent glycerol-3-phosphate dehydrogenase [Geminicoccaceae bacterium]|nr:NAD(P)H-dependent glycerol-3-phosphate dehydrogenase [Geminicoccaceae bacterium]